MFDIRRYTAADHNVWNRYVDKARNATFLFYREYMDYHSERFADYSILFFKERRLFAIMPAHADGEAFCSHLGLTYGGLLMDYDVTTADVCRLFAELNDFLRTNGFKKAIYRPVPWVYHRLPSEEDLYAMFWQCNARLQRRLAGTAIFMDKNLRWRKDHIRRLRLALNSGIRVEADGSLSDFWPLLEENLRQRFGAKPEDCLVFEDSFNGLKSGRASGAIVVGLSTSNSEEAIREYCDIVIPNYKGLDFHTLISRLGICG